MSPRFVLLVEGPTERCLPEFFKRWLDHQLQRPIRIVAVSMNGAQRLWRDTPAKFQDLFDAPNADEIVAVFSLVDLASELPFPNDCTTVAKRCEWGKKEMQDRVDNEKFRHFFVVHELEAWLLSQPERINLIFQKHVRSDILSKIKNKKPEEINNETPPSKLLETCYQTKISRDYES